MINKHATQYDIGYSEYLDSVIDALRIKGYENTPERMKIEWCYNLNKSVEDCVKMFL
jgi:hypothetical protein